MDITTNIQKNVSLAPFTTWKIGGAAKYFVRTKTVDEVVEALNYVKENHLDFFVLGGGSNILVSDLGFDGLVIKMELDYINISEDRVTAGAGVAMSRLAAMTMQKNLTGLEWAVGIPGTVGGATFGNSNCFGGSTGISVKSARLMDAGGNVREVKKDYFKFDYDYSILQKTKEIAMDVTFKLEKISAEETTQKRKAIAKTAAERVSQQPLGKKVAGSVFKASKQTLKIVEKLNKKCPEWKEVGLRDGFISSGFIIDKCLNLKGYTMEKMKISDLHANFLENLGNATAKNAKDLIDFVKKECKNKLGIELEEEIKYVGQF